ncbi:MAG: peptide chain release factor 2 [Burkholderiales bacterium]|nr:peptide chain release factor 2 [Phycisphaerae bacterium]
MHENLQRSIDELEARMTNIRDSLDLDAKQIKRQELEDKMGSPGFWDNQEAAKPVISEMKILKATIDPIMSVLAEVKDCRAMLELGNEAGDQETLDECDATLTRLEQQAERIELQSLLDGKADAYSCFITIQAGEGGTEAQDWTEMLARMYLHFWERRGWDVSEVDLQYGEQAGFKSVTYLVKGEYAFGYMKTEGGTHRLVRISPFNSQGKRMTSFAGLDATPQFPESDTDDGEIPETDLDIMAFVRASGPGGQNVNKVASAVRITHKPTGVTVTCSVERSQQQNRRLAMSILKGKIELIERAKRDAELRDLVGEKGRIGFGTQIRSYVLDDRRVKDHRTNYEVSQVEDVLDRGNLDPFIDAELRRRKAKKT